MEGEDRGGIVGHPVVRPGCEVELGDLETTLCAPFQLWEEVKGE